MSFRTLLLSCAGVAAMAVAVSHPASAGTLLSPAQMDRVTAGTVSNEAVVGSIIAGDLELSASESFIHVLPVGQVRVDHDDGRLQLAIFVDDTTVNLRDILDGRVADTFARMQLDDALGIALADARAVSDIPSDTIITTRDLRGTSGSEHTLVIQSAVESQGRATVQSITQAIQQTIGQ